jgi:hypothetical protein
LAAGQVQQKGGVVPQHLPMWFNNQAIQDAGIAGRMPQGSQPIELGLIAPPNATGAQYPAVGTGHGPNGENFCDYDVPSTVPGHYFCLSANVGGNGQIAFGSVGGGTPAGLNFLLNGVSYPFPFLGSGNVLGPSPAPAAGNIAAWNGGLALKDSTFNAALVPNNRVLVTFPVGQTGGATPGIIATPDGSTVPGLGSTCTGGVQEAENYAFTKGWSVEVRGVGEFQGEGPHPTPAYLFITCANVGLVMNPLANRALFLSHIQVISTSGAAPTIKLDSMMKGKVVCDACEIANQTAAGNSSTTVTWALVPTNSIPNEGVIGIVDSELDLGNASCQPTSGTGQATVLVDLTYGPVVSDHIRWNELNNGGGGTTPLCNYNFLVVNQGPQGSFAGNTIDGNHTHLTSMSGIQIGGTTTNQQYLSSNIWRLGDVLPGHAGANAITTFGRNDIFTIGQVSNSENVSGNYRSPFYAQPGAIENDVTIGLTTGAAKDSGAGSCSSVEDFTNWQNNYKLNGQLCSQLTANGHYLNLPVSSIIGGSCSPAIACTNAKGQIVPSGSPTNITVNFGFTSTGGTNGYLQPPQCTFVSSQTGAYFYFNNYGTSGGSFIAVTYTSPVGLTSTIQYSCQG